MEFSWKAHADCHNCGLGLKNIEPILIIDCPKTERKYIICPCCLKLLPVYSASNNMRDKMLYIPDVDEYTTGKEVIKMVCVKANSGDKRAAYILSTIRRIRAQIGLEPLKFKVN